MNPYASYATTAVDLAGTNHIIWENNGQLIHAVYDPNSGIWNQARPVSNATGIANLKLITGNLIPYVVGNNTDPSYAPGLMAFWEQGQGNAKEIYAVVGRYDARGNVVWSQKVQLTQDGVADANLDAAIFGNGLVDVVYQKVLGLDPRAPQYAINPAQLAIDAANPNRDDTDLYHSYVSVVLDDNGNPGLEFFPNATNNTPLTIPLTFNNSSRETAIYYPLGPGVQGISSSPPSGRSSNSNNSANRSGVQGPTASFQAGATRGFNLIFGNPAGMVNGQIGSALFKDNFGLQLSGNLGLGYTQQNLQAALNLQISDYKDDPRQQSNPNQAYSRSSSVQTGALFSVGGFGVGAINLDASGQINYDPKTGVSTGRQRSFFWGIDLFKNYNVNFGSSSFSVIQAKAQIDLDIGFEVAYTFSDPKPGTKPPFILNLPGWASGIFTGAGSGLYSLSYLSAAFGWGASAAEASVIGALGGLASNFPIVISAASITMPPLVPWPGKGEYNAFGWGVDVPIGVTLTGTAGILNNTLSATVVANGQIDFEFEVDPKLGFSIPWQTGLQVGAQLGAFTISWSATEQGTLVNTDPTTSSSATAFNSEPLASVTSPQANGAITATYNPYTGGTNHYQTPFSQAINQAQVNPNTSTTAQIGYVTLSNGGSNYLDGRSGSFQTYVPGSSTNDPALVTVFVNKGVITNLTVTDQGSGYGLGPLNFNLNASGGTGGSVTVTVQVTDTSSNTGRLSQATVINGGSGYLGGKSGTFVVSPSSIEFSTSQPFNPGLLGVTVTNGVMTNVAVIDAGSGYVPGQVQVDLSQNGGGGTGGVAVAQPINTQLSNVVNDGPPSISSITYGVEESRTTAVSMAWVADGVTDSIPLGQQTLPLGPATTRVQTALVSGTDWSEPETIPGAGSTGFNVDPAIGFYLDSEGNPVRVVVWSHADARSLTPNSTNEEITSAVLASDIYFSIAPSGQAWSTPQPLAVNSGTDTKVTLGAGSNDSELIAAWVNTPIPDKTTGATNPTIYAAVINGTTQPFISQIPNVGNATGKGIASLEVGEFLGNPALYWSDTTVPGYAYTVLKDSPALYYRLDNRPGAVTALNWASGGKTDNAQYVGTVNLGQPGALLATNGGGDANTSAGFTGQGYVLAPSVDNQSSLGDFSVEFWVNFDNLNPGQSLVDQGLYDPDFVSPTATIPLTIVKTPTQQDGAWGYAYAVTILPTTQVTVTSGGTGVSPFNLDLTSLLPGMNLTLADGTTVTLNSLPVLNLNVENNVLGSITVPQASQILGTTFVANANAQNDTTSTTTLEQTLSFEAVPGWYVRTGENQNLVFNAGGGEASTNSLTPNTWYYVTATYNSSTQVASLYLNGEWKASQPGSRFSPSSVPLLLGYNFQGKLDEVAYYNSLLTLDTNTVTLNSIGQASNLQTNSNGEITAHYQNRFNDPNAAEDATFYSVYDPTSQAWSAPTQFSAAAADTPTNPLLERAPVVDIVGNSFQLGPDGQPDTRVQIQLTPDLVAPGVTITGIKITSVDGLNWTVGSAPDPGWAIGVTVDGQLLNPRNPSADFAYTVMSLNPTLDLYFEASAFESVLGLGKTVNVTFYTQTNDGTNQPTKPITTTIIPNPSSTIAQATAAGKELIATGVILENEVTALNQINSGVVLNVPDNAGQALVAGETLLNGQVGIAISQPSANSGAGAIWILPAGSTDALDQINLTPLSESVPPPGGVLITNSAESQTTNPPQIGQVLVVADVDGDTVDDLIIGAPQARNSNGNQSGNIYIISGKSLIPGSKIDLATNPGVVTLVGTAGSQAGFALAAGDVNGDGFADIVVGAPYATSGGQQVGAAYLVLGGSNFFQSSTVGLGSNNLLLTGESGSYQDQYLNTVAWTSQVGFSVAVSRPKPTPPFDQISLSVNGDSFADIVIGAPNYRQTVSFNGQGINSNASAAQVAAYKKLLTTIANSGPGSPYSKNINTGRAYLIFGSSTVPSNLTDASFNGTNGVILDGSPILAGDSQVGFAVSTGNDVNGDGLDDVVIGAPAGNNTTGLAFVLAGQQRNTPFSAQSVLSYQANLVIGGSSNFSYFGKTLNLAGDVNQDGLADILIGAPDASYSTGQAHVLFGKDNLWSNGPTNYISFQPGATQGALTLNGGSPGSLAAGAVWSGADLNGDGIDDLLLSAPYGGSAYAVLGHPWLADDGNLKLSKLANDQGIILDQAGSGEQVANLGDINGDGFADSLLGLTPTAATIVFGGGTQTLLDESLGTVDLTLSLANSMGFKDVFGLGDVNGDSLQDFGAIDNNNNAYLVLGSVDLGTKAELTVSPLSTFTVPLPSPLNFGTAAGDLNGDGFADVIVGFQPNNPDAANYNQLYLAFGNATGKLDFYSLRLPNNRSVTAAGDINGDGIDDLILGNGSLNQEAGGVYVLFGNSNLFEQIILNTLPVTTYPGTPIVQTPAANGLNWDSPTTTDINANFNDPTYGNIGNTGLSTVVFNGEIVTIWVNNQEQLAFTYSTDSVNWQDVSLFPGAWQTDAVPGLVEFNNQLYAYWYYGEFGPNSTAIYYSQYQGNGQWGELSYTKLINNDLDISNGLGGGIDLIEYNNTLFAIWQGAGNLDGNALYFSQSTDGINWATPQGIPDAAIFQQESVPSLVVFQNTLYAYYVGVGEQGVYYTTFDSATNAWTPVYLTSLYGNNALTNYGLSLVNVDDKVLYAVWAWNGGRTDSENPIFMSSTTDGVNWTVPNQVDDINSWGIPSLYVFENTLNLVTPSPIEEKKSYTSIVTADAQQIVFPTALGDNLAPVGDVNGDGFDDVVVYAPFFPNQTGTSGSAYLWFGTATGFSSSQVLLTGANLTTDIAFSTAGDVNGDGFDDILIGNPNYSDSTNGQNAGISYVVFGASNLTDLSSINLSELQPVSTSGGTITDGKIGAISLTAAGSGYLSNGSGTFNIIVTSSTSTEAAIIQATVTGGAITGVQVTNPGAGFTSINSLNFNYSEGGGGTGANVTVNSLVSLAGFQIVGDANSNAGQFVSGGGDVNGDGFDDIAIGAPGDSLSYVLFGGDFTASVNQFGSIGDDTLEGTATGDVLMGQAGDDVLLGNGGLDVLLGATGNDWLQVQDTYFRRGDGGSGTDTLALYGYNGQAWDLTTLAPGNRIKNIEVIDIRNYGSNLLTLNQATILQLSPTKILTINGDSSDQINLSPDFTANGTQYVNGQTYNVYQAGIAQAWINRIIPSSNISFTAPTTNSPIPLPQANVTALNPSSQSPVSTTANSQGTQFSVSSPVVAESGKALVFIVTRTGDLTKPAAAQYRTLNDTAQAGSHYDAQVGYVVFGPGETVKEVNITLIDDQLLGPRQRQMQLGLTPLSDSAATTLSHRTLRFNTESGSQLRNLGMNPLGEANLLSQSVGLPFNQLNFNVSTVNGNTTTLTLPFDGLANLNSFSRFNPSRNQYEDFFFDGTTGVEFLDTTGDSQTDALNLHLVDGGRGDSDGVVNGVVSGFNAPGQVTPGPIEVNPGVFLIPTSYDGQLQFQNLNITSQANAELGFFTVDDADGRIDHLLPTDPGYLAAAQARQQVLFQNAASSSANAITSELAIAAFNDPSKLIPTEFQANGEFVKTQLAGNQYYGFYWNQDGQAQISVNHPDFKATAQERGYYTLAWGQQQWEMVSTVLVTPGQAGETLAATIDLARAAAYNNTVALYRVDSLTGGLDTTKDGKIDLRPGDAGYTEAALNRTQDPLTGLIIESISANFSKIEQSVTLAGAAMYGLALISNGTVSDFLSQNPTNAPTGSIHSFFNFEAANPDGTSHVRRLGQNLWGFEDLLGGGDRDYNDILLQVQFSSKT